MKRLAKNIVLVSLVALTAACGGGGSGSSGTIAGVAPAPTPTPSPSPTPTPTPPIVSTPVTPAGYILAKSTEGADDLEAGFDISLGLQQAWGTGRIPGIYDPEEGAFRFVCGGNGDLANDDPLVYFKQAGASHLHQVWGNADFDAETTPQTLAASAQTNCNATAYSLNRSSYWMPTLIYSNGDVALPDLVLVYYKRKTASSSYCDPKSPKFIGICTGIPNQLRMVFGWDSNNPTKKADGAAWFCSTGDGKHYSNLDDVFNSGCNVGAELTAQTVAPHCWDGKYLDTPDHRSHMAFGSYAWDTGRYSCPSSHPYLIPQEENKVQYTVTADMFGTRPDGSRYSRVRLSSDAMLPGAKPGETLHADYIESWVGAGKKIWMDHCINKGLDCSGGDLGNGKQLIGASEPTYGWKNPKARVQWTPDPKT